GAVAGQPAGERRLEGGQHVGRQPRLAAAPRQLGEHLAGLRRRPDADQRVIEDEAAQPGRGLLPGGPLPGGAAVIRDVDADRRAARLVQAQRASQPDIAQADQAIVMPASQDHRAIYQALARIPGWITRQMSRPASTPAARRSTGDAAGGAGRPWPITWPAMRTAGARNPRTSPPTAC